MLESQESQNELEEFEPAPDSFQLSKVSINLSVFNRYFKGLDIIDALIIEFMQQTCNAHRHTIHRWQADGRTWTRIHAGHIRKALPIIGVISNRTIQRRLSTILNYDPIGTGAIFERRIFATNSIPAYSPTEAIDILTWQLPTYEETNPENLRRRQLQKDKLKESLLSPYTAAGRPTGENTAPQTNANRPPLTLSRREAKKQLDDATDAYFRTLNSTGTAAAAVAPPDTSVAPPDTSVAPPDTSVAPHRQKNPSFIVFAAAPLTPVSHPMTQMSHNINTLRGSHSLHGAETLEGNELMTDEPIDINVILRRS
jgi:hypothetical protein